MRDKRATALLLRSDGFVYDAAGAGHPLSDAPPSVAAADATSSATTVAGTAP